MFKLISSFGQCLLIPLALCLLALAPSHSSGGR